jgi:hypothetical protein
MISALTFKRSGSICCVTVCALLAMIYPASSVLAQKFTDHGYTPHSHVPPFQREKQTRSQSELSSQLQSPDTSKAQSLCVEMRNDNGIERSVPVRLKSTLRLSFRHSIYGSRVEELFTVRRNGFELTQLRYSEARLVDFYGYENAEHENGVWVVRPRPAAISSLSLNSSAYASMSLRLEQQPGLLQPILQPGRALRLTVAACKDASDG